MYSVIKSFMSMARFGWHAAAHPKALYLQLQLESAWPLTNNSMSG